MSNTQILQVQLEQLEQLIVFLNHFKSEIGDRMNTYRSQVDGLYSSGLPQETYVNFQSQHLDETHALINSIISKIDSQSIPFIHGNIQRIQELLEYNR